MVEEVAKSQQDEFEEATWLPEEEKAFRLSDLSPDVLRIVRMVAIGNAYGGCELRDTLDELLGFAGLVNVIVRHDNVGTALEDAGSIYEVLAGALTAWDCELAKKAELRRIHKDWGNCSAS